MSEAYPDHDMSAKQAFFGLARIVDRIIFVQESREIRLQDHNLSTLYTVHKCSECRSVVYTGIYIINNLLRILIKFPYAGLWAQHASKLWVMEPMRVLILLGKRWIYGLEVRANIVQHCFLQVVCIGLTGLGSSSRKLI
jgi:hypothetical protein